LINLDYVVSSKDLRSVQGCESMKRVVVIGSGIAGLSAVYHLVKYGSDRVQVTLLESGLVLGGHATTVKHNDEFVDLGFQVFNRESYPTLCALFEELGVASSESDMSFATDVGGLCVKYGSQLTPLLKWLVRNPWELWSFLRDKHAFHVRALEVLSNAQGYPAQTVGEFMAPWRDSFFYRQWIIPFCSAVWSLDNASAVENFDLHCFLRFMLNHGFLTWSTLKWKTLRQEGCQSEVKAFERFFAQHNVEVHCSMTVTAYRNKEIVAVQAGQEVIFAADAVIFAVPAAVARTILGNLSPSELYHFQETCSVVYLHTDSSKMPADKDCWASWNVVAGESTYWLKSIQGCRVKTHNLFVSVLPPSSTAPCRVILSRQKRHPLIQKGSASTQQRLLKGSFFGDSVFFCGAWLQFGFHEDGALTGAIAARRLLCDERVPVLRPCGDLQHLSRKVWVSEEAKVMHQSHLGGQHRFSYQVPETLVVSLEALPRFFWGGVLAEDHWNNGMPLLHSICTLVLKRLGFFPAGSVFLVTTMRAFGQVMNPISLYVCFNSETQRPCAFVLEVHNYPWGELACYVLDARSGSVQGSQFSLKNVKFRKTLHVSPFHPHPEVVEQFYEASITVELAKEDQDTRPFHSLQLSLELFDEGTSALLHSSTWTVQNLSLRKPRPLVIALQTLYRILREALTISRITTRHLFINASNPIAPIGMQSMVVGLLAGLGLCKLMPIWILVIAAIASWNPKVPLLRDIWLGMIFAIIARMVL
jgi:predicted NAD/FAD-binding protein